METERRALLMQARVYRLLAKLFAFTGLVIFIILYLKNIEGRLLESLKEPLTVIMVLFPFVPAIILSMLAKSSEKKYLALKKKDKEQK